MRNSTFITCIALLALLMSGQSVTAQNQKPFWADGYFQDLNNSYVEVASAIGWEVADARKKAYQEIINRRSLATGTDATVVMKDKNISVESNHDLIVKSRVIDEYIERIESGTYKVYLLVQTAKNPSFQLESVAVTNKYPFSARCFVPGMAQIHKGSITKGGIIIGAEALGIGGIVTSFCMRASNLALIQQDPKHKATYAQRANTWGNIGYGCIAFTAAIYIYNIIDGAVATGKPHIQVGSNSYDMAFAPMVTPQGDMGLAMQVNF